MPKNLGKKLERRINKANYKYRKDRTAMIKKEEIPIHITKLGPKASMSTVDYIGIVPLWAPLKEIIGLHMVGAYIAFDAKETKVKTSFPLANIHQHQLEFLKYIRSLGGIAFFLIQFTSLHEDEAFMVPIPVIDKAWENARKGKRKSIRYKDFKKQWLVPIDNYLNHFINQSCINSWIKMYKL
jgi:recombination protein U